MQPLLDRLAAAEAQIGQLRAELDTVARVAQSSGTPTNLANARIDTVEHDTIVFQDWDESADVDTATSLNVGDGDFAHWPYDVNLYEGNHCVVRYSPLRRRWEPVGESRKVVGMKTQFGVATTSGVVSLASATWSYQITDDTDKFTVDAEQGGIYWATFCGDLQVASGSGANVRIRVDTNTVLAAGAASGGGTNTFPICVAGSLDYVQAGGAIDVYLSKSGTVSLENGYFSVVRLP